MSQEVDKQNFSDSVLSAPQDKSQDGKMKKRRDQGVKVRIKFRKYGAMKFIGHLDIMRFFQKLIRRAGIDIAYSEGFHPHQIMSFANPLGVGLLSNGEYVDITLNSATSSQDIKDKLNATSVEGIEIVDVKRLPEDAGNAMASVAVADYSIRLLKDTLSQSSNSKCLSDIVSRFYEQASINVEKKTKKGSKIIDLKTSIHELRVTDEAEQIIFMKVNAGSSENIRPELVLLAIYNFARVPLEDFSYIITREEIYDEKGCALINVGEFF